MDKGIQVGSLLRNVCHLGCALISIRNMPNAINGMEKSEAAANAGFLMNIMAVTAMTVRKSGISVVTQLLNTSFNELMSPIILERIFPVGRLSKSGNPASECAYTVPGG